MTENPTWLCVVAAALRDVEGRWLMSRRPSHKQHGGLWEFPGGKVEAGESPAAALVREIREEIGIDLSQDALVPTAFAEDQAGAGHRGLVILLYSAAAWRGDPVALEPGAAIDWFTPAQIAGLDRPPLDCQLCARIFGNRGGQGGVG